MIEVIGDYDDTTGQSKKRKAIGEHEDAPQAKRPKMPIWKFKDHLERINVQLKKKFLSREDLKYYIRHWRYGMDETTSFFKYYQENNNNLVNVEELDKAQCMEMVYSKFAEFYGVNEVSQCKDCSYQEKRHVEHSM